MNNSVIVTGSCGLIGSEVTVYFSRLGFRVTGIDNNFRATFFGPEGDTRWSLERLRTACAAYRHVDLDIRDRTGILSLMEEVRPALIIHTAAQPSHDRAAAIPFLDFEVNAVGTLNLLEAARQFCPESPFIHMSTNKVYGDLPNSIALEEHFLHRPIQAFPLRGVQGRVRHHGAGIRPLFQYADVLSEGRMPDGSEPFWG
jgi:CDP-paratose 2-epimerase